MDQSKHHHPVSSSASSKIKLVVTDLDGTLLDEQKRISPRNMAAIRAMQEKGIIFTMASGRSVFTFIDYLRQAKVDAPCISCNGALIYNEHRDEVVYSKPMDPDQLWQIHTILDKGDEDYMIYSTMAVYYPRGSVRIQFFLDYNELAKKNGTPQTKLIPVEELFVDGKPREPVYKIFFQSDHDNRIEEVRRCCAAFDDLETVQSMPSNLDIMPSGVSKGKALLRLADHLGLSMAEVAAFGDHNNDAPMLREAGLSFGMANGTELVRASCTHIAPDNEHDGFAQMVERYIL